MRVQAFNVKDLVPLRELCMRGEVKLSYSRARLLCQKDKFPAVKLGNVWHSTEQAVRGWNYRGANKAFRRLVA